MCAEKCICKFSQLYRVYIHVGDAARDMQEGRNAGCGLVVGVLTGIDDGEVLASAGADAIVDCITDLGV